MEVRTSRKTTPKKHKVGKSREYPKLTTEVPRKSEEKLEAFLTIKECKIMFENKQKRMLRSFGLIIGRNFVLMNLKYIVSLEALLATELFLICLNKTV